MKTSRGFDFSAYKRSSLTRRFDKRMQVVGVADYAAYLDYLQVHPEEFTGLFNTILINVTGFFRDAAAWEYVAAELVPRLLGAQRDSGQPLRLWSAGCAAGAEAYTLAMLLAETMGVETLRDRVKIYATDVDEDALATARQASYTAREVEGVPAPLLEKYFEPAGERYLFSKELRRAVIFGRHDLIQDAPISRIDLLACRNALMYFNAETQARILARFHFALNPSGYLMLGKAETLLTHATTFVPVELRWRIFTRSSQSSLRDRLGLMVQNRDQAGSPPRDSRLREVAADTTPVAQLVIDAEGMLREINGQARALFGLSGDETGRPLSELEVSYRPIDLRGAMDRVRGERRPLRLEQIEWPRPNGEPRSIDLEMTPLLDGAGDFLGIAAHFTDVTSFYNLQEELQRANQELETTLEELQSTNEELETTNEELQSTVEELETTNEELQSTNEELETMNEELQSTNEELETVNDELRVRGHELNATNAFLESILASLRGGVVVVDRDLKVQVWNRGAEDLWGLRQTEVADKHLVNLDIGLPVQEMLQSLRACLSGEACPDVILDATNRRGKTIRCHVTCTPLCLPTPDDGKEVRGAILVMEERDDA